MTLVAVPWFIVAHSTSGELWNRAYLIITALILPWSWFAGKLVDSYRKKDIFIAEYILGGLTLMAASILCRMGINMLHIALGVFAYNYFLFNIHYPALYAYVQSLYAKEDYIQAASSIEIQGQISNMLGGVLAALLMGAGSFGDFFGVKLASWELKDVLLLDGMTYLCALVPITMIARDKSPRKKERRSGTNTTLEKTTIHRESVSFSEAIDYLRENPGLLLIGFASYLLFAAILVEGFYVSLLYVRVYFESGIVVYGFGEAFFSFGALVVGGVLAFTTLRNNESRTLDALILSIGLGSLCFACLAFWPNSLAFVSTMFTLGIANAATRVLRTSYLMQRVRHDVYGRVANILTSSNVLARLFLLGLVGHGGMRDEPRLAFALLAGVVLTGAILLTVARFRYMQKK